MEIFSLVSTDISQYSMSILNALVSVMSLILNSFILPLHGLEDLGYTRQSMSTLVYQSVSVK